MIKRQQELKQALEIQINPRTPQDILRVHLNNPGHKFLTRSERGEDQLKQSWSQSGSHSPRSQAEPVRRIPAR